MKLKRKDKEDTPESKAIINQHESNTLRTNTDLSTHPTFFFLKAKKMVTPRQAKSFLPIAPEILVFLTPYYLIYFIYTCATITKVSALFVANLFV